MKMGFLPNTLFYWNSVNQKKTLFFLIQYFLFTSLKGDIHTKVNLLKKYFLLSVNKYFFLIYLVKMILHGACLTRRFDPWADWDLCKSTTISCLFWGLILGCSDQVKSIIRPDKPTSLLCPTSYLMHRKFSTSIDGMAL